MKNVKTRKSNATKAVSACRHFRPPRRVCAPRPPLGLSRCLRIGRESLTPKHQIHGTGLPRCSPGCLAPVQPRCQRPAPISSILGQFLARLRFALPVHESDPPHLDNSSTRRLRQHSAIICENLCNSPPRSGDHIGVRLLRAACTTTGLAPLSTTRVATIRGTPKIAISRRLPVVSEGISPFILHPFPRRPPA